MGRIEFTILGSVLNEVGKEAVPVLSHLFISWLPALFPAPPSLGCRSGKHMCKSVLPKGNAAGNWRTAKRGETNMFSLPSVMSPLGVPSP